MKRIFSAIIACLLVFVACFSLTACGKEDLVTAKVNITIYNGKEEAEDVTLTYTLYRHLAPKSVAQFMELAETGYYENTFYYEMGMSAASGVKMLGAYKYEGTSIVKNSSVNTIEGEFAKGGTTGSDLTTAKGSVCLWRWWDTEASTEQANSGYDTGSAGMLCFPTRTGLFTDSENNSTLVAVAGLLDSDDESQNGYNWIIGNTAADVSFDNWNSSNTETYHVFYVLEEEGNLTYFFLNADEYKEQVTDGDLEVFDPNDADAPEEYRDSRYTATTLTIPKYEYRIVVNSVECEEK